MFWPQQYFTYLARRTLVGIFGLFAVIWLLVVSIDLIEAMREVGKVEGAGMALAVQITLFRTPQLVLSLSPFVLLFGTLWAFGQMAKSSEIAVMRSAGLSVWRLVAAPVALAIGIGLLTVTAFDPIAAGLASKAQTIKNEMRGSDANLLNQFRDGVWLRQADKNSAALIHANSYDPVESRLNNVIVWRRTLDGVFIERWDADTARVQPTSFILENARRTTLHGENEVTREAEPIQIDIDLRALREDIAKPTSLSVWQLQDFARMMGSAGMRTLEYKLRFHDLWSLPVKLVAMVLIACAFALGMNARAGGTAGLMGLGIAVGFALFIISELSSAIAQAQIVPVGLAAWGPGLFAVLFATTLLLYREDG
ncbi:MAG: LPS export ABC transporter permease LptG [Pseudomonadota bacterium]